MNNNKCISHRTLLCSFWAQLCLYLDLSYKKVQNPQTLVLNNLYKSEWWIVVGEAKYHFMSCFACIFFTFSCFFACDQCIFPVFFYCIGQHDIKLFHGCIEINFTLSHLQINNEMIFYEIDTFLRESSHFVNINLPILNFPEYNGRSTGFFFLSKTRKYVS